MPRLKLPVRSEPIQTFGTPEQKETVVSAALKAGMSVSTFVLTTVLDAIAAKKLAARQRAAQRATPQIREDAALLEE
jgi:uncharacterized protein (DUF1778 family)